MIKPLPNSCLPEWLKPDVLKGMLRGIERESLRMQDNGFLSQQAHPVELGSALTHPYITTDYSEALLEFITPPKESISEVLKFLQNLHSYTYQHLQDGEMLWPLSMPCMLDEKEENIPLAQYGTSNIGLFKTLYRRGLGVRYGRRMQTISGVHYNLSFPDQFFKLLQEQETDLNLKDLSLQDYRSHRYFGLIRNFIRFIPMGMYLLGASPTVCRCFVTGREHNLQPLIAGTLHLPQATALRMGRLGYQNSAQRQLGIHYNHLKGYLEGMQKAVHTSYPDFKTLGLDDDNGQPIQINDHVLQIENEYYSLIRPKQVPQAGETPSQALAARGVAYVELRAVDVNPYSPVGITEESAAFLETLALYCLLLDSPEITEHEQDLIELNQANVVNSGRLKELQLKLLDGEIAFPTWMQKHLNHMYSLAKVLDRSHEAHLYAQSIEMMQIRVADVEHTLSAQMLTQTQDAGGTFKFGSALATQHQEFYKNHQLDEQTQQHLQKTALESIEKQKQLEAQSQISFCEYLKPYRNMADSESCN